MNNNFKEPLLKKISFLNNNNDVRFDFLDSLNGEESGYIICKNVFSFCTSSFCEEDVYTPYLVLDLEFHTLDNSEVETCFKNMNFMFTTIPKSSDYYFLKMEGAICISLICEKIEVCK